MTAEVLRALVACALYGHSDVLVFGEAGRLFLRCDGCGRETPGWDLVRAKELV